METGWPIESLLLCNISQKRKCALLFQMDFKGNKRPSALARFICWVSLFQPFISLQVAVEAIFVSCTYLFEVHSCGTTFLKANLRQLSWTCLSLTSAPPSCVSLNPRVSDKVVMCSLLLHVPTHPPQDLTVVLFKNNQESWALPSTPFRVSTLPRMSRGNLSQVSCRPPAFLPRMSILPKEAIPFILMCFGWFHSSFTKERNECLVICCLGMKTYWYIF